MIAKNAKRWLLAVVLALLLPGAAGAADFGPANDSFWRLANPAALFGRLWEGLTSLWAAGPSIDPNGEGAEGVGVCSGSDCGASIDPNG
jgi:hypothetical protein